jgi:hypothetical protein
LMELFPSLALGIAPSSSAHGFRIRGTPSDFRHPGSSSLLGRFAGRKTRPAAIAPVAPEGVPRIRRGDLASQLGYRPKRSPPVNDRLKAVLNRLLSRYPTTPPVRINTDSRAQALAGSTIGRGVDSSPVK